MPHKIIRSNFWKKVFCLQVTKVRRQFDARMRQIRDVGLLADKFNTPKHYSRNFLEIIEDVSVCMVNSSEGWRAMDENLSRLEERKLFFDQFWLFSSTLISSKRTCNASIQSLSLQSNTIMAVKMSLVCMHAPKRKSAWRMKHTKNMKYCVLRLTTIASWMVFAVYITKGHCIG